MRCVGWIYTPQGAPDPNSQVFSSLVAQTWNILHYLSLSAGTKNKNLTSLTSDSRLPRSTRKLEMSRQFGFCVASLFFPPKCNLFIPLLLLLSPTESIKPNLCSFTWFYWTFLVGYNQLQPNSHYCISGLCQTQLQNNLKSNNSPLITLVTKCSSHVFLSTGLFPLMGRLPNPVLHVWVKADIKYELYLAVKIW